MIEKIRVVTTHGNYERTLDDAARDALNGRTAEQLAKEFSEILGATGRRDLIIDAVGIGWVGLNPSYVVAVEVVESS